jgi:SAM-dependent methyltransferase
VSDGFDAITAKVERYYTDRFHAAGATAAGVDWRDEASQRIRFEQLLKLIEPRRDISLLDYGCGYGALCPIAAERVAPRRYVGFDLSNAMIEHARAAFAGRPWAEFTSRREELRPADFVVASGIFNVKLDSPVQTWKEYVFAEIASMAQYARHGFAFNVLTSYSDPDRQRSDLYYADPGEFFDLCKRRYSRNVALLHDYDLYEFTILVRLSIS